jgi:hypothetical protein
MPAGVRRERIVLFGGSPNAVQSSTDALYEWNGAAWTQVAKAGTWPAARSGHRMAYDASRGRVVMVGGAYDDEVWEWDGLTWTARLPAHLPAFRQDFAFAYHPRRQRVVMHGGTFVGTNFRETWEWNGTDWTQVLPAADSGTQVNCPMTSDVNGHLLLVGSTFSKDTWLFRYESTAVPDETCTDATVDIDGDGLAGCADADCWLRCDPLCPPGAVNCPATRPRCGNGACDPLEDAALCPADCS